MAKEMRQDPVLGGWHEVEVEDKAYRMNSIIECGLIISVICLTIAIFFSDQAQKESIAKLQTEVQILRQKQTYTLELYSKLVRTFEHLELKFSGLENGYAIDRKNFHDWFMRDLSRIEQIEKRLDKGEKK